MDHDRNWRGGSTCHSLSITDERGIQQAAFSDALTMSSSDDTETRTHRPLIDCKTALLEYPSPSIAGP